MGTWISPLAHSRFFHRLFSYDDADLIHLSARAFLTLTTTVFSTSAYAASRTISLARVIGAIGATKDALIRLDTLHGLVLCSTRFHYWYYGKVVLEYTSTTSFSLILSRVSLILGDLNFRGGALDLCFVSCAKELSPKTFIAELVLGHFERCIVTSRRIGRLFLRCALIFVRLAIRGWLHLGH